MVTPLPEAPVLAYGSPHQPHVRLLRCLRVSSSAWCGAPRHCARCRDLLAGWELPSILEETFCNQDRVLGEASL